MGASTSTYENHLDATTAKWFAVRTRFRSEKVAHKELTRNALETYLPIKPVVRKYNRKIRKTELPLIPSFVFVKITKGEYAKVLETEYVSCFLKFGGNLLSIPEKEIDLIRRLENVDFEITAAPATYAEGDEVEIIGGALIGIRGKLVSKGGKGWVCIELVNSGHILQIEVDTKLLRKL